MLAHRFALALSLTLCASSLLADVSRGQAPTVAIQERSIADLGPPGFDVNESALAIRSEHRLAATTTAQASASQLARQARGSNESSAWFSGDPATPSAYCGDLSLAVRDYTPEHNLFVVMGHTSGANGFFRYHPTWPG